MNKLKLFISVLVLLLTSNYASAQMRYKNSYQEIGSSIGVTAIASDYNELFQVGGEVNLLHRIGWRNSKFGIKSNIGYSYVPNNEYEDVDIRMLTLGTQLEYLFLDYGFLNSGGGRYKWSPYVAIGANLLNYNISNFESLSDIPDNLAKETGWGFSTKAALGVRFNVNPFLSFFFEANAQYMFSDNIDGKNPDSEIWLNHWNDHTASFVIGFTHVFGY